MAKFTGQLTRGTVWGFSLIPLTMMERFVCFAVALCYSHTALQITQRTKLVYLTAENCIKPNDVLYPYKKGCMKLDTVLCFHLNITHCYGLGKSFIQTQIE